MGTNLLVLLITASVIPSQDTTPPFSSAAVQQLIERAIARRQAADSAVTDYRAQIRYRLSVGVGRRRWARVPASTVEEQVAAVQWQRPNDLRVDVMGRRARSRSPDFELSSVFDRPWFVPRGVDDSVRIFSNEFPATGALHPLARNGPRWYRYDLTGALSVTPAGGVTLRLLRVEVTPRRTGPALIAGQLWIDSATAEVVRLTFRYVGTALWARPASARRSDSTRARRINTVANQMVSIDADLEYGLQDGRYWMPYRQLVAGRVQIPLVSDLVIPFRAVTTFEDYEINTGRPIVFTQPLPDSVTNAQVSREMRRARRDSIRAERERRGHIADSLRSWDYAGRWPGGRYELHRPSNDSLSRYTDWPDSLSLRDDPAEARRLRETEAELARLAEELPERLTGQAAHGIAYERLTDVIRYDRVQGLSMGAGYQVRVPGLSFTSVYATARYGFSDERVTGRITLLRDAPGGRILLSGYREVEDLDPFGSRHGFGNTLNGIFAGHDNGDYAEVRGASAGYETSLAPGLDLGVGVRLERQRSVARQAKSAVNDFLGGTGVFPLNPPIDEGDFSGGSARLSGLGRVRWTFAGDLLGGEGVTTGRVYGDARVSLGSRRGGTLRLKAGIATTPTLQQSLFRLGGVNTVRGFEYGFTHAPAFWAAQVDIAPLSGRYRPVLFVDAGQAARPADLFSSQALVGGGVGLSVFGGILRFDLSHPITPDIGGKVRFDIVVQAPR